MKEFEVVIAYKVIVQTQHAVEAVRIAKGTEPVILSGSTGNHIDGKLVTSEFKVIPGSAALVSVAELRDFPHVDDPHQTCPYCGEAIGFGQPSVADRDGERGSRMHLHCSVEQQDGDDLDNDHGDS